MVRPAQVVQVYYGFGYALGKQFGATMSESYGCNRRLSEDVKVGGGIRFRVGLWTVEEEEESSNYKELKNLVDTVEGEATGGRLRDCNFFCLQITPLQRVVFIEGTQNLGTCMPLFSS